MVVMTVAANCSFPPSRQKSMDGPVPPTWLRAGEHLHCRSVARWRILRSGPGPQSTSVCVASQLCFEIFKRALIDGPFSLHQAIRHTFPNQLEKPATIAPPPRETSVPATIVTASDSRCRSDCPYSGH